MYCVKHIFLLIPLVVISTAVLAAYVASFSQPQATQDDGPISECTGTALCITDRITSVIDGDTVYLKDYRIRLSLVDTPEMHQPGFSEATSFTSNLCPVGSVVTVDQDDGQLYDVYGRLLGKVTCSGKVLNAELLENGHARILTQYCAKSEFASEEWAKNHGC